MHQRLSHFILGILISAAIVPINLHLVQYFVFGTWLYRGPLAMELFVAPLEFLLCNGNIGCNTTRLADLIVASFILWVLWFIALVCCIAVC